MARKYTREFKNEVCKLIVEDNVKLQIVAEKFSLNQVMVYRWVDEYKTFGSEAFVGKGKLRSEDAKVKQMEKELELLRQENEILKKAAAYFAKAKQQD
ncbi:transposase [uncultured Clostridium sp.]|uniref:transposase n=1 Tax=uncultured Clostridium sp. TaxID=59620 RepID=UPI00262B685D|nr:transposase [uncultured Clostridium sp.]